MERQVSEGSLHKWFKGSKSKDGKGGWVNVVTGGTCASDEPGEGTPKCVSSAKRASMTKAERLSAARRKKKADPGQQQKSGAAKPTYVSTDSPRKKKKKKMNEGWSDKYKQSIDCDNPKGFSQKAHCQGKKKMKETYERSLVPLSEKAKKCWPGYEKKGTKKMFGKTYNNCVKKEEVEHEVNENAAALKLAGMGVKKAIPALMTGIGAAGTVMQSRKAKRTTEKQREGYKRAAEKRHDRMMDDIEDGKREETKQMKQDALDDAAAQTDYEERLDAAKNSPAAKKMEADKIKKAREAFRKGQKQESYESESEIISEVKDKKGKGSGTKDACYHKVKSRYSVWPSAYASGALVKCRKVGAANWGNSSKKEAFSDWKSEFIWEDGDSSKKLDEGALDRFETIPGKPGRLRLKSDVKVKPVPLPSPPRKPGAVEPVPMPQPNFRKPKPKLSDFEDHYDWRAELGEDWQKTNRQDKTDGMSQKAVNAYRKENPGSKLKTAVTKKPSSLKRGSKDAKRRKSFCSRMKGMKKRLTSAKTARDPDSRINKALRRWNC